MIAIMKVNWKNKHTITIASESVVFDRIQRYVIC